MQNVLVRGARIGTSDLHVGKRKLRPERVPARRDAPDGHFGVKTFAQKGRDVVLVFVDLRQQHPARGENQGAEAEIKENDAPEKGDPGRAHFGVPQIGSQSERNKRRRRTHAA